MNNTNGILPDHESFHSAVNEPNLSIADSLQASNNDNEGKGVVYTYLSEIWNLHEEYNTANCIDIA